VLLIQVAAAALLLLGSGLLFHALLAMDAPPPSRPIVRRFRVVSDAPEVRVRRRRDLPRAA
jgi:hypothetical protein